MQLRVRFAAVNSGAYIALAVTALCAAGHIWAEYFGPEWQRRACKPATLLTLIMLVILAAPTVPEIYRYCVLAGLVLSLVGDVMLLDRRRFLPGLGFFLLAHLAYIGGFHSVLTEPPEPLWLIPLIIWGGVVLWLLRPGLGRMHIPVAVYVSVVLVMVWLAMEAGNQSPSAATGIALGGALLFGLSDTVLAINRFRRPFNLAQLTTLSTYYAAQTLFAVSVLAHAAQAAPRELA